MISSNIVLLRMGGLISSLESMVAIIIMITMAIHRHPLTPGFFVSSFTATPNNNRNNMVATQLRVSSTAAAAATTTSPVVGNPTITTSAATLSYLNSLQSITSNPQLFPATSDTIEALLAAEATISPKDFLMNLSREVMQASSSKEEEVVMGGSAAAVATVEQPFQGGGRRHSPLIPNSVNSIATATDTAAASTATSSIPSSLNNNSVNLISEGMTAEEHEQQQEEAQQTRMARLQHSRSSSSSFTATSTATTTIKKEEEEKEEVVPIINNHNPISSGSSIPHINRGVSGLKQAAAKPSYTPSMPFRGGGAAFVTATTDADAATTDAVSTLPRHEDDKVLMSDDIMDDELLLAASFPSSTKFLQITNPNTPLIATSTGITTGIATYELLDEYAYQFNTIHNGMIVDMMDRKDDIVEKWDELIGAYYKVPSIDVLDEGVVVSATNTLDNNVVAAATATTTEPMEFSDVVSPEAPLATTTSTTTMTTNEVTMDQGGGNSVINTPVETISPESVATAPTMEFSDTSGVGVDGGSDVTITTPPSLNNNIMEGATSLDATTASSMEHGDTASTGITPVAPSLNEVTVDEGVMMNARAEHMQYGDITPATPSLNEITVDEGVMNGPPALSYDSGNTDVLADVTSAAPVEATQYSNFAGAGTITAAPSSLNEATVLEGTTNSPIMSYDGNDRPFLSEAAPIEPTHYSHIDGSEMIDIDQDVMTAASAASSHEGGSTGLLSDVMTSAPAEPTQHYDTTTAQATMNQDVSNTPASSGNTDLLADATTSSAPVPSTQYSDVTGADMTTTSIDQGITSASASSHESGNFDLFADASSSAPTFAESTHQERWFTAPPTDQYATHVPSTSDGYTHTDYVATFDQGSYSSGSFNFGGSSSGGSFTPESYSTWHSSQGGSNPLRELASSLPPPIDRVRGTGGDYYQEDLGSQWVTMQGDGFQALADTPPVGGMGDLQSTDFSNPAIMGTGEFGAPTTSIHSDVPNSFTTQSPDISYDHIFHGADKMESTEFAHVMGSVRDNVDAATHSQQLNAWSQFASSSGTSMNDALISAKAKLFGSVSHSLGEIQGKVSAAASSMKGLGNGAQVPVDTHTLDGSLFQSAGETFQSIHPPVVVSSAIHHAGDTSIADIGNGILNAVKFMAGILLTVVDANLDLAAPGSSSAIVLENVQSSVNSMLDNASYTVMNVINDVGNLSLKDIVHNLMVLIVATADVLMKVMNAVIYLLSGKDTGSWALQATSTVNQASSQLLAQADDVTHRSIGDLASSIGDYSYHVGNELVALLGSLHGVEGAHFDGTFDMVTTAMQTGFTM